MPTDERRSLIVERVRSSGRVVAPLGQITHLVTETGADQEALAPYRAAGIEVIRA